LKRLFLKAAGAAAAGALLHACGGGGSDAGGGPSGTSTLLQLVEGSSQHTLFVQALQKANLSGAVAAAGAGLTMYAPTNTAFDQLAGRIGLADGAALVAALDAQQWADILNFHLVAQLISVADMRGFAANDTRPATRYLFNGDAAQLIFVVEGGVLFLWDGVGRSTITVATGDVAASNGVAHYLNDVLLPRGVLTVSQMIRASIDSLSDFAGSLNSTVIADLDSAGPFTVFVPVNNAINATLATNVVRNHIVAGQSLGGNAFPDAVVLTTQASRQLTLRKDNVGGDNVLATLSYGTAVQANITDVDFFASNGVYHVISNVITP
jgi:transforming growth factor-beta-induced protein